MTLRDVEHNLSNWHDVLVLLAREVVGQGKSIPPKFLKERANGHRTHLLEDGSILNVNLCNDDVVSRAKLLAGLLDEPCTVTYAKSGAHLKTSLGDAFEKVSVNRTVQEVAAFFGLEETLVERLSGRTLPLHTRISGGDSGSVVVELTNSAPA